MVSVRAGNLCWTRLMESPIQCHCSVAFLWGRAQKGDDATAWPLEFYPGESCPPALTLMPDASFSSRMPLVTFQLLPWCWSPEGVSLVSPKSVVSLLRVEAWGSWFLLLLQPPLNFTARSYGDLSFWHWNPGLGGLMYGWDLLLLKYPSRFLSTTRVWNHLLRVFAHLRTSYPSGWMWLL